MSASMREIVVFPFVPATTTVPCRNRLAILSRSRGSMRSATKPGAAVPPPRPRPRIAAPVALAAANAAISRASRGGELGAIGEDDGGHLEPLEDDPIATALEPRTDALGNVDDEHDAGRLLPDFGHLTDVIGSLGDDCHPDLDPILRSLVDGQKLLLIGWVGSLNPRL